MGQKQKTPEALQRAFLISEDGEKRESGERERERERRERAERESGRQHGAFGFGSAMMAMTFRKKETRTTEVIMNS